MSSLLLRQVRVGDSVLATVETEETVVQGLEMPPHTQCQITITAATIYAMTRTSVNLTTPQHTPSPPSNLRVFWQGSNFTFR